MALRSNKKTSNTLYLSDILDSDKDGNSLTREDLVADSFELSEAVENEEEVRILYTNLQAVLDKREAQIIRLRYGLGQTKALSQQKVSEMLGISRSYVSRIEKRAVEKLRHKLKPTE